MADPYLYRAKAKTIYTDYSPMYLYCRQGYMAFVPEGYLVNIIGLLLVALGGLIVYIVTKPEYARQPLPEEQHIRMTETAQ